MIIQDVDQKKQTLKEKILSLLEKQGKKTEEHIESIEKFLSTLPSSHVDNLMEKLEELEGENVEKAMQIDTTDYKNSQSIATITKIRDLLRAGDMEGATELATSLHIVQ